MMLVGACCFVAGGVVASSLSSLYSTVVYSTVDCTFYRCSSLRFCHWKMDTVQCTVLKTENYCMVFRTVLSVAVDCWRASRLINTAAYSTAQGNGVNSFYECST